MASKASWWLLVVCGLALLGGAWSGCSSGREQAGVESDGAPNAERPTEQAVDHAERARGAVALARGSGLLPARLAGSVRLDGQRGFRLDERAPSARGALHALVPMRASEPLLLERAGDEGTFIEVSAAGRRAAEARVIDGVVVYPEAEPSTDVVVVLGRDGDRVEELRVLWSEAAPASVRYQVRLGPALRSVRQRAGRIEVLDTRGELAFYVPRAVAVDAEGTEREVALAFERIAERSYTLIASIDTTVGLAFPVVFDPVWVSGPSWPAQAVVALNSLWLRQGSTTTGDAAVIDASPGPTLSSDVEAVLGKDATLVGSIRADDIRLKQGGHVTGDAGFNALINGGVIDGAQTSPLALPLAITVPAMPTITPGTSPADDVTVAQHADVTLAAGAYGNVALLPGSAGDPTVLTLSGGVYHLLSLDVGNRSRVECATPCELRLTGRLGHGNNATIGPKEGSDLLASDIAIFVAGQNGSSGELGDEPKAAAIGSDNEVTARIFVPNGTLVTKQDTVVTGTLVARDVEVGPSASITKELPSEPECAAHCAALIAAACTNGPTDQAACELECEADLTTGFCLEQHEALVVCSNQFGSVMCDAEGVPTIVGCESEESDLAFCEAVCAATDDANLCTADDCDCTLSSCDPNTAVSHTPLPAGSSCADADLCNGDELCDGAVTCLPGTPVQTSDGDPCTLDVCDPGTGQVTHPPAPAGTACPDNDLCNGSETCDGAGTCTPGTPPSTDDGNACTLDGCDPLLGVTHTPAPSGTPCLDADVCNGSEACDGAGTCVAGSPLAVDDGNACTVDSCHPLLGALHTPEPSGTPCLDQDVCNGSESCDGAGTCQTGTPLTVDDANPCTKDACDPLQGVSHVSSPPATPCADTDVCDGVELCDGQGSCEAGVPLAVDDGDPCTKVICDPATNTVTYSVCPADKSIDPQSPIDPAVVSDLYLNKLHLFTGPNAIQKGVADGTIEPLRMAMVRGRVMDTASAPLQGVTIRVLRAPEYGYTVTQPDGWFDLAVNGGGELVFTYEREGYVTVHRHVTAPYKEWALAGDVVMTPYDTAVTQVALGSTQMQVAQSSVSTDSYGSRRATLLFKPGTDAQMIVGGTPVPLASPIAMRGTEVTVNRPGDEAMFAELPPSTQYTYAVDLSVDAAIYAGAHRIELSNADPSVTRPVVLYVEDYLGFGANDPNTTADDGGIGLPTGIYDRDTGRWEAIPDGLVVKIVGVTGGVADLDLDNDEIPDPDAYAGFSISVAERTELAGLYPVGSELWRMELDHFSSLDMNPGRPLDGECSPGQCGSGGAPIASKPVDGACGVNGSRIECQNQTVGHTLPVAGTGFTLHYQSDRVLGRSDAMQLTIPLTGAELPPLLRGIFVDVEVGGRKLRKRFSCVTDPGPPDPECAPNQSYVFQDWDGRDDEHRLLQGAQAATVRVGYVYRRYWYLPKIVVNGGSGGGGGGGGGGQTAQAPPSFGSWGSGASVTVQDPDLGFCPPSECSPTICCYDFAVWQSWPAQLGAWSNVPLGLGGLSLSPHHAYDPLSRRLYRGDGTRRSNNSVQPILDQVAGRQDLAEQSCTSVGPTALDTRMDARAVATAPDGARLVIDFRCSRILRIAGQSAVRVAGGVDGFSGDGGPATAAKLSIPTDLEVAPDGSIYIADRLNHRIRKIDPDGIITTVAGNGVAGFSGDGGPATLARLNQPRGVALGPDGSLFIAEFGNKVVRRVSGGIISTVAGRFGGGTGCSHPDGTLATAISFEQLSDVESGSDGSIYVADHGDGQCHNVWRIKPGGGLVRVAGMLGGDPALGFSFGATGDGGPAKFARIYRPNSLAVDADGTVYMALGGVPPASEGLTRSGVRVVTPEGTIYTLSGNNPACSRPGGESDCGIGGPARLAHVAAIGVALDPDRSLSVAGGGLYTIRSVLPGASVTTIVVPSEDGSAADIFDGQGKHLATKDAVLDRNLLTFGYDARGQLIQINEHLTGGLPLTTTIVRDAGGFATRIVAPFGQETFFGLPNVHGFTSSIRGPGLEPFVFTYDPTPGTSRAGLMTRFTDPNGNRKDYEFDGSGRLVKAFAPDNSPDFTELVRTDGQEEGDLTVALTTPTGETTSYSIDRDPDGSELWTVGSPDGTFATTDRRIDDKDVTMLEDGTVITVQRGPEKGDRGFSMLSPVPALLSVATGGKTLSVRSERTALRATPLNPLLASQVTEHVCINGASPASSCSGGRKYTSDYKKATSNVVRTSPAARKSTTLLDALGRPTTVTVTDANTSVGPALEPVALEYYTGFEINGNSKHAGLLKRIVQGTALNQRAYGFVYDNDGNLASIIDPLSRTTHFSYDPATRLTKQVFPDNEEVRFRYDDAGNVTLLEQPGTQPMGPASDYHQLTPSPRHLLDLYTPPLVGTPEPVDYFYNASGQLATVVWTASPQATFLGSHYDGAGRLSFLEVFEPGRTSTLTYGYGLNTAQDDFGKLVSVASSLDGLEVDFAYAGSLLVGTTLFGAGEPALPENQVAFGYDNELRVSSETVTVGNETPSAVGYVYGDADGLLTQAGAMALSRDGDTGLMTGATLSEGATLTASLAYNGFAELASYGEVHSIAGPLYDVSYQRDNAGRVIAKSETAQAQTRHYGYDYDAAGRLVAVYESMTTPCVPLSACGAPVRSYGYDANGNRTSATGVTGTISYDKQDRLTEYDGVPYLYTPWSALAQKGTTSDSLYDYDLLGNLRQVSMANGSVVIDYSIDPLGRRVARKKQGAPSEDRYWLYRDGLSPVAELDASGSLVARFVYGSRGHVPDYMIRAGSAFRFVTDQLGSVRLVVKVSDGSVAQRIEYDEWGRVTSDTAPGFQPFGFAGGLYDHETGLVRFGARDYDAETGRWTAKDPILFRSGQANLYEYARGDPINFHDPTGLCPDSGYLARVWEDFFGANKAVPGLLAPPLLGLLTAGPVGAALGLPTAGQVVVRYLGGALGAGALGAGGDLGIGVAFEFAAISTEIGGAVVVTVVNAALVGGSFEVGLFAGSLITAALPRPWETPFSR